MRTLSAIVAFTAAYAVVAGAPPDKAEEEDLTESESQTSYGYGYGTKVEDDHRYDQFQKCWNGFVSRLFLPQEALKSFTFPDRIENEKKNW